LQLRCKRRVRHRLTGRTDVAPATSGERWGPSARRCCTPEKPIWDVAVYLSSVIVNEVAGLTAGELMSLCFPVGKHVAGTGLCQSVAPRPLGRSHVSYTPPLSSRNLRCRSRLRLVMEIIPGDYNLKYQCQTRRRGVATGNVHDRITQRVPWHGINGGPQDLLERLSFNRQKPEGLRVIEKIQSHASTIMGWEIAFHAYRRIGNGQKLT
jgi:hypothetical protein